MDCVGFYVPRYDLTAAVRDEIRLEIGVRNRLKQVVEARLEWARALKDALEKEEKEEVIEEPAVIETQSFETIAKDVHSEIESACDFMQTGLIDLNLAVESRLSSLPPLPDTASGSRLRHAPTTRLGKNDQRKELYLRDPSSTPPLVYKIACADCGRADFPVVQGLLNHARLKHHVEYPNHDACIQRCAVVVPEDEVEALMKNGIEVTGMAASLRRLFEMALGASVGLMNEENGLVTETARTGEGEASSGSLLTKTLGHHVDTPALAPFLGRAPKRRQINAYNEDEEVDVLGSEDNERSQETVRWKMTYQKRSQAPGPSENDDIDMEPETTSQSSTQRVELQRPSAQGGSRFHITARIIVSDWSLRLPERLVKNHAGPVSHKWMLSIHSPSYSLHASTFISKMTVQSLTVPSPVEFQQPIVITEPPYRASGVTDKPFLASITLELAGSANKPFQIEHYVDLELNHSQRPVLGDEQYLDIELDRNTVFLPRREDTSAMVWLEAADGKSAADRQSTAKGVEANNEHITRLKALLPRFPMTRKGGTLRTVPRVPYLLPQSISHFHEMVPGRQKAIQWGRARAIWEAYRDAPTPAESSDTTISSPLDVYRWLDQEGHFPKLQPTAPSKLTLEKAKVGSEQPIPDLFCAVCGYLSSQHPFIMSEDGRQCVILCALPEWMRRPPLLDVHAIRARNPVFDMPVRSSKLKPNSSKEPVALVKSELAVVEDPTLVLAVNKVASSLQLPCFKPLRGVPEELHDVGTLYDALAPSALLAIVSRLFIRKMIDIGVKTMLQLPPPLGAPPISKRKDKSSRQNVDLARRRLLTPAHILYGTYGRSHGDPSTRYDGIEALLVALGRLGTSEGLEGLLPPTATK